MAELLCGILLNTVVLEVAIQRLQAQAAAVEFAVFQAVVLSGTELEEAAAAHGLTVNQVAVISERMLGDLGQIVRHTERHWDLCQRAPA